MKRQFALFISFAFSALICSHNASAQDPQGSVVYSLPSTTLVFDVEAVQENFYAGPYARFAAKYLGIEVRQQDESICHIKKVKMTPYIEADLSKRYSVDPGIGGINPFLTLSSQGLISLSGAKIGDSGVWRFPSNVKGDFSDKGVNSNLITEETTLYRNSNDNAYSKISVQQNMTVQKSPEKKAAETAELIFELRQKRLQIVTGDTDATYSGEAMGAAVEELTRLEKEYLSLFIGYSVYQEIQTRFEIIPQSENEIQKYVAFRISDKEGIVSADNLAGTPVILELTPENITSPEAPAKSSKVSYITYRIPASCKVKLYKGTQSLLESRVPVYQLGVESSFPVKTK